MRRQAGFWPEKIVEAYRHHGGEARNQQIYEWVAENVGLTDHELGAQASANGRPRYQNTVRGIINDMLGDGRIVRIETGYHRLP